MFMNSGNLISNGTPNAIFGNVNPFQWKNENVLTGNKRFREEGNIWNFSPNLTAGSLKAITPIYNNHGQNPTFFMFNQTTNFAQTPTGNIQNCEVFEYSSIKNDTDTPIHTHQQGDFKAPDIHNQAINLNQTGNANVQSPNIVVVPTPVGSPPFSFYTWVMPSQSQPGTASKKPQRKQKLKKVNYRDESSD
jgi:hypothetical protein